MHSQAGYTGNAARDAAPADATLLSTCPGGPQVIQPSLTEGVTQRERLGVLMGRG